MSVIEPTDGPNPEPTRGRRPPQESTTRVTLLSAASKILRDSGTNGLTIGGVLDRTQLGTRAFYRNFASKDELVQAVFLEMAHVETLRLRRTMTSATDPVHAVALWITDRLDLAFDPAVRSDLRSISREAQSQLWSAPHLVSAAFDSMLAPLREQIEEGNFEGLFPALDPVSSAQLVHGALWVTIEAHWAAAEGDRVQTRRQALTFCLRGLGAPHEAIAKAIKAVTAAREEPAPVEKSLHEGKI